jgi:hypothetical protein
MVAASTSNPSHCIPVLSLLRVDEDTNHPVSTPSPPSIGLLVVRTIEFEKILWVLSSYLPPVRALIPRFIPLIGSLCTTSTNHTSSLRHQTRPRPRSGPTIVTTGRIGQPCIVPPLPLVIDAAYLAVEPGEKNCQSMLLWYACSMVSLLCRPPHVLRARLCSSKSPG